MIKKYTSLVAIGMAALSATAALRINEIRIDHFGTDTDEYAEIKGDPGESLDGVWYLVIGDDNLQGALTGYIEFSVDLSGDVIPAGGHYMIASEAMTIYTLNGAEDNIIPPGSFENNDNVTHLLVRGYDGTTIDIDTNDDGIVDVTPWTEVIDAVGLVETVDEGDWNYGVALGFEDVGPDGSFVPAHVYRYENTGEWVIGSIDLDLSPDTPKAANPDAPTEPVISSFSTNYPMLGNTMTVFGDRLTGTSEVTIAGISAAFTVVNDETLEVTVPDADYGPVSITTPGGTVVSGTNIIVLDTDSTLAIAEDFSTEDSLGVFSQFSVSSRFVWTWGSFEGDGYVSMNGYDYDQPGAEEASDDWLISPAIDLSTLIDPGLHFQTAANFSGPDLEVLISTDYDGTSDPSAGFTWTPLSGFALSQGGYELTDSGIIDLDAYADQTVYIAFRYLSNGSASGDGKTYQVSQVLVGGGKILSNDNPWANEPHVNGWVKAEFTGPDGFMWLYDADWPYVYSLRHGWLVMEASYWPHLLMHNVNDDAGWIYTAPGLYPFVLVLSSGEWAWFDTNSHLGNRRFYIYNNDTGWTTLPDEG